MVQDLQFPHVDTKALGLFLGHVRRKEPCVVVVAGDLVDCQSLSLKFKEAPKNLKHSRFKQELDAAKKFLAYLRKLGCEVVLMLGNHEDRLDRFVRTRAAQLAGLLNWRELLDLDTLSIRLLEYGRTWKFQGLHLTHGHYLSKNSAATALKHVQEMGVPVGCGHSHRGGVAYRTLEGGRVVYGFENFCLCRQDMHYLVGRANWQLGWSSLHLNPSGSLPWLVQYPVIGGSYYEPQLDETISFGDWERDCLREMRECT